MDLTQYVLLATVIAGVTELLHRLRAKDFWVAGTIFMAAVVGGLFGFFHYYPSLDTGYGIAAGFAASGALTALGQVGNKSVARPSSLIQKD